MELKFDKDTNVCEYFNERNGSIIHVLSNETGLWFNLNDSFKLFSAIKADKLWFSKNLQQNEKKWVEFYRSNGKCKELFIPEQKMHDLISKIRDSFNENVDFIYGIIADYDMTCINVKDLDLDVQERIALYTIKSESQNFIERTEKYMNVLEGKTELSDYYRLFENKLDEEINNTEAKYDNSKCPEDIRQENKPKRKYDSKVKSTLDELSEISEIISKGMNDIYFVIDSLDESSDDNCIFDLLYDEEINDRDEVYANINHAQEVIKEKQERTNKIKEFILNHEAEDKKKRETEKNKESTCPSWIKDLVK